MVSRENGPNLQLSHFHPHSPIPEANSSPFPGTTTAAEEEEGQAECRGGKTGKGKQTKGREGRREGGKEGGRKSHKWAKGRDSTKWAKKRN
jgi:hypothetical protein